MDDLKEFFKSLKHSASSDIHTIVGMIGSPLEHSSLREEEKRGESFPLCSHWYSCYGRSSSIYRLLEYKLFTKTFILMSISTNTH